MSRRKSLTDNMVAKLKPGPKRLTISDPDCRGHYLRITLNGVKTFVVVAREPHGKKQLWVTVGDASIGIDAAREEAREIIRRIKAGKPPREPLPPKPDTFGDVAANYLKRYVEAKGLRTQPEIERILAQYALPAWGGRDFASIRRGDVVNLLDSVEDKMGPRQADSVLAIVRGLMNWQASRSDDYVSPIVRGMRRTNPKDRERKRKLGDDEIRVIWKVAEGNGRFGAIIRLALLTAQRRQKVAAMRWADVTVDGAWSIPSEVREKGNGGTLVLPEVALAIIREQKRVGDSPYVFAGRGDGHFVGFSHSKRAFDARVTAALREAAVERGDDPEAVEPLPPWRLHDLRRSARSLMARAGVRPDVGERVMGHVLGGVEGIYNRYDYDVEKADALRRLAGLIDTIINPPADNVVEIRAAES